MSDHKISWLNMPGYKGETWNPIVGCSKISEGCQNCYAERMAVRIQGMAQKKFDKERALIAQDSAYLLSILEGKWRGCVEPTGNENPKKWKAPRMIFVCSMGDLFHVSAYRQWIKSVFNIIRLCRQHIFVILTKRPEEAYGFFKQYPQYENLPNVWLGVTAENQQRANERIPILLQIKAAKRFVSIEPMLGPIDFDEFNLLTRVEGRLTHVAWYNDGIDWIICGGETGPKARPMHPDWVRSLRDQCQAAQVPFFFKQWGEWCTPEQMPNSTFMEINDFGNGTGSEKLMQRVSHKKAGRLLDGVEYNEFPK